MNQLSLESRKNSIVVICCFLMTLCFVYTVFLRRAWFAKPLIEWVTAHSVCVTRNWIKEGAFNLRFMHILNPASIEFDTLLSRDPYVYHILRAHLSWYFCLQISLI